MDKQQLQPTFEDVVKELKARIGDLEVEKAIAVSANAKKDIYIAELEAKLPAEEPKEEK
ncbi:hypothetical protein CPT_Stahl56 [Bacillus phage Stahl]|uniref:Uncharacterized protein n=1 Tax=Bacillus phage Stahl TaxID=1610832 RepID=A0A0E3GMN8_9CAUD|nr:hypothetical protein CPT_Stahl56 [Bacillus phage Stahl]AKA61484.1 hypothetical protein CPT_Stahl56 [Bacillus phage Stahl]